MELGRFESADFKYCNILFNFQYQNTQIRYFWSQISGFLVLHQTFRQVTFNEADFKYDQLFLKNIFSTKRNHPNKTGLAPNFDILSFCKFLQLDKYEGADFKYDNIFLK